MIIVWVLLLAAAMFSIAWLLEGALTTSETFSNDPDSAKAERLLVERLPGTENLREVVIVTAADAMVDDHRFRSFVRALHQEIRDLGEEVVAGSTDWYESSDPKLVSGDRHTTILPVIMAGDQTVAKANVGLLHAVLEAADGRDGFHVLTTGRATLSDDYKRIAERDMMRGESIGCVVALLILVVVFGTVVSALLPLLLAAAAIVAAMGLTGVVGHAWQLSFFVKNMITMMGLAVGIDYSLFFVSRYREERARGRDRAGAVAAAGATAGRTVFFSGMTVVLALSGLLLVPIGAFESLAVGAILVVLAAVAAALTLLPAVLSLLGDGIEKLKVPGLGRRRGGSNFWAQVVRLTTARPLLTVLVTTLLLLAAALPLKEIKSGSFGVASLPEGTQSREGYEILGRDFSYGFAAPARVVITGGIDSQAVQDATGRFMTALEQRGYPLLGPPLVDDARDLELVQVVLPGDPKEEKAVAAVRELRQELVPAAFEGSGAEVLVGGAAARNLDYFDAVDSYMPVVIAFVLGLSFVLLTVVFRSVVLPLKAILMNLLSVGAAYGLMVLVFQEGVGAGLFGFHQVEAVEAWIPLFLFALLFGLSMDYHVFLLSRIRERYGETGDNDEAVRYGLEHTAAIISGAALIMVVVFGSFASGDIVTFQQMGFGLAVAVLLDATVVRIVLVPAAMKLLGDLNWYLPRWLQWLPEFHEPAGGKDDRIAGQTPGTSGGEAD